MQEKLKSTLIFTILTTIGRSPGITLRNKAESRRTWAEQTESLQRRPWKPRPHAPLCPPETEIAASGRWHQQPLRIENADPISKRAYL